MEQQIISALLKLDPTNDDHWTEGGSPALAAVSEFGGFEAGKLKRDMVTGVAPRLTRQSFAEFVEAQGDDPEADDVAEVEEAETRAEKQSRQDDLRDDYNARIAKLQAELEPIVQAQEDATRARHAKQDEIDKLINERDDSLPKVAPEVYIKEHLARQHALRAQKVAAAGGGGLSPLDQSLRGRKRQVRTTLAPA
jgi:hypothetical protein